MYTVCNKDQVHLTPSQVEYTVRKGYTGEEDDENMVEYEDQENQEQDLQVHMGPEDCQTM